MFYADQFNNFNTYYKLVFIDWILTFAWSVILFIFAYMQTLADVSQTEVLSPVVVDLPPLSARQF